MELFIGNSLLLLFVIIEILILYFLKKEPIPWKEITINLNSGHILLWVFRGLEVSIYYYVFKYFSLNWVSSFPIWTKWLLAFILWDFCFYWLHRLHHFFKVLWGVHSVHHEGEHFSLSLGIRNSWYSSITSIPFFTIMALIGIPVDIFVVVSSIHYFIQFYNHNHLVKKSGWLEYVMVTPSHHRVHHGKNQPYFNKNFSGTFVIWDKIFNTFQEELDDQIVIFGVDNINTSYNPVVVNNTPFIKLFSNKYLNQTKSKNIEINISNFILVSGALLLFILFVFYIYFETQFKDQRTLVLFTMIFLGTIGNGLLSDGNKYGVLVWSISAVAIPIILVFYFSPNILLFRVLLIISVIHGLLTLTIAIKAKIKQKIIAEKKVTGFLLENE
jgi:sterol desaturase/sphingolipid hydroxylase (fatty acid hydroxylase superfamily)